MKDLKEMSVIQLLVCLEANHNDLQKSYKRLRYDWSLEDVPIKDVCEYPLDRMVEIITELKRRIDAYKAHAQILKESQKVDVINY